MPESWFTIYTGDANSVRVVGMSEEFRNLRNGEIGRLMHQWTNYSRILASEALFSKADKIMYEAAIEEAETIIKKETSFTPQQIWETQVKTFEIQKALHPKPSPNGTK